MFEPKSDIIYNSLIFFLIMQEWISVEEVMLIFNEFDSDGDGFISPKELRNLLNKHQTPLTDQQLEDMMKEADRLVV